MRCAHGRVSMRNFLPETLASAFRFPTWERCAEAVHFERYVVASGKALYSSTKRKEFQLSNLPFETKEFQTKSGLIKGIVQRVDPSVYVLVKHQSGVSVKTGSVLMYRKGSKTRGHNGSQWHVYDDIYVAWRSVVHALRSGGIRKNVKDGDLQEMMVDIDACHAFVGSVFNQSWDEEEFARIVLHHLSFAFDSLRRRKDPGLASALEDLLRGSVPVDSRGRRNPGASAMAIGGVVHRLHERQLDIGEIMRRLNVRAFRMMKLILDQQRAYQRLFAWTDPESSANPWSAFFDPRRRSSVDVRSLLEHIRTEKRWFKSVHVAPFRNNSLFVAEDLGAIEIETGRLSRAQTPESIQTLKSLLLRLHQGIGWALRRHELEMEVLVPVSVISEGIRRHARIVRKAVSDSTVRREDVVSDDDVQRLQAVVSRLERYRNVIRLEPDRLLRKRVRSSVLTHLNEGLRYAGQSDWNEMKSEIQSALSFL